MEKPLWMIYITHMFIEIYLLIQVALIPVIIQEFQLNLLEASLIATVPSFAALFMNIPSGFLADHFSANQLLCASMLVEGVSAFLASQTNNFWILVLAVSLLRISSPIYHISGLSQISLLAKPERISRSIGFHNAFGNVGSAAGVVSLTVFLTTLGWRWTYLFWCLPIILWGFIILALPHLKTKIEKTGNRSRGRLGRFSLVFSSGLLVLLVVIGIREIGSTGSTTFMTTYFVQSRGISEALASLIFSLGPFVGIVGSVFGGYMAERVGAKRALSWAILACAIFLALLSLVSTMNFIALIYIIYSFFGSTIWAPVNTLVAQLTPKTDRGISYSVYFFTEGLLTAVAPTVAAGAMELTNSIWFVLPFSAMFLTLSVIILQLLPSRKQQT